MGLLDDINNAFKQLDPKENGVSDAFNHAGQVLDQNLDPNKNNVANTFNKDFPEFFNHTVGNSMKDLFGKGGHLDHFIGEPSKTFFEHTLPTGTNQFFNDMENKVGKPSKAFFNNMENKVGGVFGIQKGVYTRKMDADTTPSYVGKPMTSGVNNNTSVSNNTISSSNSLIIPLVVGGVIIAVLLYQK